VREDSERVCNKGDPCTDPGESIFRSIQKNSTGEDSHPDLNGEEWRETEVEHTCHQVIPFGRHAAADPHDGDECVDDIEREQYRDRSPKVHKASPATAPINPGLPGKSYKRKAPVLLERGEYRPIRKRFQAQTAFLVSCCFV